MPDRKGSSCGHLLPTCLLKRDITCYLGYKCSWNVIWGTQHQSGLQRTVQDSAIGTVAVDSSSSPKHWC
jgi:hypothetical protein